jgi:hypothetical protein
MRCILNLETEAQNEQTPWIWTTFKVSYWVQSAFILTDVIILLIALIRIKKILRSQQEFNANECYMTGHIAMLFFLFSSFVLLAVGMTFQTHLVLFGGIYGAFDFFVLSIMCAIMMLVNNDDGLTLQKGNKKLEINLKGQDPSLTQRTYSNRRSGMTVQKITKNNRKSDFIEEE